MQILEQGRPLVSVVVPTKNSEQTIEKCLMSLKKQTYRNVEIIVVDNFSKDKTRDIAEKYGAKIFLKGPERCTQLNFGAEKASGKYLYRVDSDFVLQPKIIEEAVDLCEKVGFDAVIIHNTSDPTVSFWSRVRKLERDCYRYDDVNVATRFWKKTVFEAIDGFDENLVAGDDYDLHNRIVKKGFKIGRIKSEEIHLGEPATLKEIALKHYYYGKNIKKFINKNPRTSLGQLTPFRGGYLRNIHLLSNSPKMTMGFVLYQVVRYSTTALGLIFEKL